MIVITPVKGDVGTLWLLLVLVHNGRDSALVSWLDGMKDDGL